MITTVVNATDKRHLNAEHLHPGRHDVWVAHDETFKVVYLRIFFALQQAVENGVRKYTDDE